MKKLLPIIAFSVLLLVPAGATNAFAMMGEVSGSDIIPHPEMTSVYSKSTNMGTANYSPLVVVSDNPALHLTAPGGFPDGVAFLEIDRDDIPPGFVALCTGALLEQTRQHILTAAHCISDPVTGAQNLQDGTQATFQGDAGTVTIQVIESWSFVHPNWIGEQNGLLCGNDIAILELEQQAPAEITGYFPDNNPGDDLSSFTKYGYGTTGVGLAQFNDMMKRDGNNDFDAFGDALQIATQNALCPPPFTFVNGGILQYDFDNGLVANDAFFQALGGPAGLGFGENEVNGAPGDSGGPDFTGNVITGVASYGLTFTNAPWDTTIVPPQPDFSWGEFSGSTRVSSFVSWIDQVLADSMAEKSPSTAVAGELLPIDNAVLLLAGAQMNAIWIIPMIVAAAAIGIIVSRKF